MLLEHLGEEQHETFDLVHTSHLHPMAKEMQGERWELRAHHVLSNALDHMLQDLLTCVQLQQRKHPCIIQNETLSVFRFKTELVEVRYVGRCLKAPILRPELLVCFMCLGCLLNRTGR